MLTKGQKASRASMLQALIREGKLMDEFLPPEEFMIVKSTPYPAASKRDRWSEPARKSTRR